MRVRCKFSISSRMTATIDVSSHIVMQTLAASYADRGAILYVLGILILLLAARIRFSHFRDFLHHELPAASWIAWTLACFLYAVLPAELFWDLYSVSYQSEAAPYLFNFLTIYILSMIVWGLSCYLLLWRKWLANLFAVLALLFGLVVAIWTTYEFHSNHVFHVVLSWLLLIPPILAIYTCSVCYGFRQRCKDTRAARAHKTHKKQHTNQRTITTVVQPEQPCTLVRGEDDFSLELLDDHCIVDYY